MKRVLLILLSVLPLLAYADDFAKVYPDEILGPVKTVKSATFIGVMTEKFTFTDELTPFDISYYNELSKETKSENWYGGKMESYTVTTYDGDSSVNIQYDSNGNIQPYKTIKFYNQNGLPVRIDIYREKDTIWVSDSLVYNQLNKVILVYHSAYRQPFKLYQSFKYNEQGQLVGGRTYADGTEVSGFKVEYLQSKTVVTYVSKSQSDQGLKTWSHEYFFDKKGRLIEERTNTSRTVYADFDKYGNWTRRITEASSGPFKTSATIVRELIYWDFVSM